MENCGFDSLKTAFARWNCGPSRQAWNSSTVMRRLWSSLCFSCPRCTFCFMSGLLACSRNSVTTSNSSLLIAPCLRKRNWQNFQKLFRKQITELGPKALWPSSPCSKCGMKSKSKSDTTLRSGETSFHRIYLAKRLMRPEVTLTFAGLQRPPATLAASQLSKSPEY